MSFVIVDVEADGPIPAEFSKKFRELGLKI